MQKSTNGQDYTVFKKKNTYYAETCKHDYGCQCSEFLHSGLTQRKSRLYTYRNHMWVIVQTLRIMIYQHIGHKTE